MSAALPALHSAAASGDLPTVKSLLASDPTAIHDLTSTRQSVLHSAITAHESAPAIIRCLLSNGAIWNDLDDNDETPACVAWRLGHKELYDIIVDAGVRAEILLSRLGGSVWEEEDGGEECGEEGDVTAAKYLKSKLAYDDTKLLDSDANGVMMKWESRIMERSVAELLPKAGAGKRVLNVGFGMGIVDTAFQKALDRTGEHFIIEPHPDVLAKMRKDGWFEKANVTVVEGRWQDVALNLEGEFDAIYFDTFAEGYSALKEFFEEVVVGQLKAEGGRFGFFHGLGADRRVSWDVYTKVVEMDLWDAGLEVEWKEVELEGMEDEWTGVRRKYWNVGNTYRLPICRFVGVGEE